MGGREEDSEADHRLTAQRREGSEAKAVMMSSSSRQVLRTDMHHGRRAASEGLGAGRVGSGAGEVHVSAGKYCGELYGKGCALQTRENGGLEREGWRAAGASSRDLRDGGGGAAARGGRRRGGREGAETSGWRTGGECPGRRRGRAGSEVGGWKGVGCLGFM